MCGEISKSPDAATAVQWAIAYAKSFEDNNDGRYQRGGDGLPDGDMRRTIAAEFIDDHVPAVQRAAAHELLNAKPNPLETEVDYWSTVVDQGIGFSRTMAIAGSDVHDWYDDYTTTQANKPNRWTFVD